MESKPTKEHQDQEQEIVHAVCKQAITLAQIGLGSHITQSAVIVAVSGCCVTAGMSMMPVPELREGAPAEAKAELRDYIARHIIRRLSQVLKSYEHLIEQAAGQLGVTTEEVLRRVDAENERRATEGTGTETQETFMGVI